MPQGAALGKDDTAPPGRINLLPDTYISLGHPIYVCWADTLSWETYPLLCPEHME